MREGLELVFCNVSEVQISALFSNEADRPSATLGSSAAKLSQVRNLLWPPGAHASLGRANLAGEAMLYVSDHIPTVLAEIGSTTQCPIQFLGLEIRPGENMRFVPVGELSEIWSQGRSVVSSSQQRTDMIRGILHACPPDEAARIVLADQILLTIFGRPAFHDAAAIVAHEIQRKLPATDGILYRSVKKAGGLNIAMRPESAVAKCNIVSAFVAHAFILSDHPYCKLEDIEPIGGITDDGAFQWEWRIVHGTKIDGLNPSLPLSRFPHEPF